MFHALEFDADFTADLEKSPKNPLEQICIRKGTRKRAQVKPYVAESHRGPIEVADLFFEDGSATRSVPFAWFHFLD
jgi:hypothetical protein